MKIFAFLILCIVGLLSAQTNLPLVHDTDVTYVGSFRLPNGVNGNSQFEYGGRAISAYTNPTTGVRSLFIGGHPYQEGSMAQVRIPDTFGKGAYGTLPTASWIQPFANSVDGGIAAAAGITTTGSANYLYGSLVYNGRLILAAGEYYGCSQQRSHGFSTLNLSTGNDFRGFYNVIAPQSNVRSLGGPMAHIPDEWRAAFGGPVIGGMWGTAITSCQSSGPSLTIFNPDSLGMSGHAGVTVAQYPVGPVNHTLCEGAQCAATVPEFETSNLYNMATRFGGLAFPSGTRSVLLFGRQGVGPFCYGTPDACGGDRAEPDAKGPHAFPYRYQIWAYDANDLLKVKAGTLKTWEVRPYAYWAINDLTQYVPTGFALINGAGYDPETRRLYVATDYAANPRIDVFQVRNMAPVVVPPDTTTLPPVNPPVICSTVVIRDSVPCPSCPPPLPAVTVIRVESVFVADTTFLGQKFIVPGLGLIQKIKTSRGVYLLVDLAGMPVSIHKEK